MKKMAVVDKKGLEYIPSIDRMIRVKECRELTTLANSTRWKLEKEGKFPKRIKIVQPQWFIGSPIYSHGFDVNG